MKNYITFPTTSGNLHDFVLTTEYITGLFDASATDVFVIKLNLDGVEVNVEHTDDAALQAEFINNIRKALIANPGVGKIPVQLPAGFEVTFIEFA
jgi:hypothetical protein